jgi:hypothetical protein
LVVAATTLQLCDQIIKFACKNKVVFRFVVLDNIDNWQVFKNDAQIVRFLANLQDFFDSHINLQEE